MGKYHWHICGNHPEFRIKVRGKVVMFEMHPFCGPLPTSQKTGNGLNLGPHHPFWSAVTEWSKYGQRVGADGLCITTPAEPASAGGEGTK